MLTELGELNVEIVVQGGAIFGNILESINFSKNVCCYVQHFRE